MPARRFWQRSHPRLQTPIAIRLSRLSLVAIVGIFVAAAGVWLLVSATGLYLIRPQGDVSFWETIRQAAWAYWGPDNLLEAAGQSPAFYLLAVLNGAVSLLLPIFLLGAFVYKLLQHDPLSWRTRITLEAYPTGAFVLTARFYNRLRVDISDVRVRAWLKWIPDETVSVRRNRQLRLITQGQSGEDVTFPLAVPAEPTTVRVLLESTRDTPDPLETEGHISIQGQLVTRSTASIVLLVEGLLGESNQTFRSAQVYDLDTQLELDHYQDIPLDLLSGPEWQNFDGNQGIYIFMYGSLMRGADLEEAGISPADVHPVRLNGWVRAWNVASDPAAKNRVYYVNSEDASSSAPATRFSGHIVSLGLTRDLEKYSLGIAARVSYKILAKFDLREMDYNRVDVTNGVDWQREPAPPHRVFTYIPKRTAVSNFERRRRVGQVAIEESYFVSVEEAARERGEEFLQNYLRSARPEGVPVLSMTRVDEPPPTD